MTPSIEMTPSERLELGFGRVHEDQEAWMYGDYFPAMRPFFDKHGYRVLSPFQVVASNVEHGPVQGSLSAWPSAAERHGFQTEPAFVEIRPTRDAALTMSDAHLFVPPGESIALEVDVDYALIASPADVSAPDRVFRIALADDSPSRTYEGGTLSLHRWNDACERLLRDAPAGTTVLKVRFPAPT